MPGSRGHKDAKLTAEDVRSAISDLGPALADAALRGPVNDTRKEARYSPCRSPFQDLSREIREEHREGTSELRSVGRGSKAELGAPGIDAEDLKQYTQQQLQEAATAAVEKAKKKDDLLADSPQPLRRSLTQPKSKGCSIF